MKKIRLIMSLFNTKSFIVITDTINDGYVLPSAAHEYLELLEPICEHLKQLGREYTKEVKL